MSSADWFNFVKFLIFSSLIFFFFILSPSSLSASSSSQTSSIFGSSSVLSFFSSFSVIHLPDDWCNGHAGNLCRLIPMSTSATLSHLYALTRQHAPNMRTAQSCALQGCDWSTLASLLGHRKHGWMNNWHLQQLED